MRHSACLAMLFFCLTLPLLTSVPALPAPPAPSRLIRDLQAGKHQTIVLFGTSLTKGSKGSWFSPVQRVLDLKFPGQTTICNGAGGGKNSSWGLEVLDENVIAHKPDCIFIEFSINDAVERFNLSVDQSRANMVTMIGRIRKTLPDCEIILHTTNAVVRRPKGHKSHRANLDAYEQVYRELAHQYGLLLIDTAPLWHKLLQEKGEAGYIKLVPDGVHPSQQAYEQITLPEVRKILGL